ncbi:glyoxalase/bleomycin resistance/dioxygenase family protein [Rhodobacteraceae bacterium 2CG4]|uniref:Glyoxalase/bleomycin resistance/dioxygenase family protein n=2 Tax=Halovulum marinum TaxID=2662447 RepID=A0A6L5YUS0_9RHOB|nr:glyoxalase/bleomycin resistance/dioxygenase family protein [Halovulum marinum]
MPLTAIYAQLNSSDLSESAAWFTVLFGRPPDARPMDGLLEWHHGSTAGMQLFEDAAKAGSGTMTLIVERLDDDIARLAAAGLAVGASQQADQARIVRLQDPDGNRVVLAEPRSRVPDNAAAKC